MTFFCKYIFTTMWICGAGIVTATIFVKEGDASSFLAWIPASIILWAIWGKLKKVSLSPFTSRLYISNFIKQIEVPFSEVEDIYAFPLITPGLIFIRFKKPTAFGKRVLFMPKFTPFSGFTVYTTAEELKKTILGD